MYTLNQLVVTDYGVVVAKPISKLGLDLFAIYFLDLNGKQTELTTALAPEIILSKLYTVVQQHQRASKGTESC